MIYLSVRVLLGGVLLSAGASDAKPGPAGDKPARVETKRDAAAKPPELDFASWISIRVPSDLRFSPDEKRLAFTVAMPPKGTTRPQQIWVLDVASRVARPFTRSAKSEHSPRWSPDGKMFAFLSAREERFQVYLLPSDGGEAERLTEGKNAVRAFEWSPDGRRIAFLAPDPKTDAEEKKETDNDDSLVVGKDDKRTRLWVVEVASKKVHALTARGWQVAEFAWAPKGDSLYALATERPEATDWQWRLLSVALDDGATHEIHAPAGPVRNLQEIEAALYRPSGLVEGAKAPLVVLIHGGPTGRWADESTRLTPQFLAAHGYAVVCPNIRGSTGYGWKFLAMNRRDWGGGDYKDVMAGVDDLVRRGIADPDRLGIMGASYGGYMAAWAITQTNRFSAAVVIAGMSDLASAFGTEGEQTQAYDRWYNGIPYEAQEVYLRSSPITHIKQARTPTLILRGERDPIDPLGQAQQLHRGLTHHKVECELVVYPREGHRIVEEKHLVELHRRFLGWFDKHLK